MNNKMSVVERRYVGAVKELPCSVCDEAGPSEAHHVKQGNQYTVVALCPECHRGPFMGWHGQKRMWAIKKMDDHDALNVTIQRLMEKFFGNQKT